MFRIESYVTSIILSYVDRYIKNFRLQDAQVSLWEGDGVFHNLDLDLEVLEQELNLPFSFVSGHINELLIHVPWTRINSEPVRITINTIECVIKLRSPGSRQTVPSERIKRQQLQKTEAHVAPPSYMSNLVNKIICNLSITCNNFILKYVEEDIVFSMNIKTLNLESVNSKWEPEFLELTPSKLVLRKLVSLSDITICLDKRNASGRIESYLEPLLYRCFLTMRLTRNYPSVNACKASSTRLDVFCEKMAFTLSEPQVPMLMRMCALALALQRKQLTPKVSLSTVTDNQQDLGIEEVLAGEYAADDASWSKWVWSWVPAVPFLAGEDDISPNPVASHTLQFGFYIENFSLALKLCNMVMDLQGCFIELESHDADWTNVQMGISHMNVVASGDCCCGTSEQNQLPFLACGSRQNTFLSGSLFGNTAARRIQERSWDYHIATVTEALLLERTPAFAIDYLCVIETPKISEMEEDDGEELSSPPIERVLIRHVADGIVLRICSGLIHRTQMLIKSTSTYDYVPYTTQYPQPEKSVEVPPEIPENLYIPQYMSRYTLFHPKFEIYPANHSPVQPSSLGRKLSRSQKRAQQASSSVLPTACVVVEWSCLDAKLTRPLNPDKVQLLCAAYSTPLPELLSETQTRLSLKVVGVCSSICLPSVQPMKILELSSVSLDWTSHQLLALPPSKLVTKVDGSMEQLNFMLSKPKLLLVIEIINSLAMSNSKHRYQASYETLFHTSLIQDAAATLDIVYLKFIMEKASFEWVQTSMSESIQMCVDACQAFVIQLADKDVRQETMILIAPHIPSNKPLLTALFQRPVGVMFQSLLPETQSLHGPILTFFLGGIRISVDPLLYTWLLYTPLPIIALKTRPFQTQMSHVSTVKTTGSSKSRRMSESSSSAPKRALTPQESVHSSSERETTPSLQLSSQHPITEFVKEPASQTFVEKVTALYPVWQSTVIYGEIGELSIYFPNTTLCSQLPQPMESSLQAALKKSSPQLQVAVVKLPSVMLLCSSLKQTPFDLPLSTLPVVLPSNIWTPDKCNFPWSLKISDLHCFTLHGGTQLKLLKPFSATCTVGVSTKFNGSVLVSLALCVHLDTTAISISVCEEQVSLLANLAVVQAQVFQTLIPIWSSEVSASEDILLSTEAPIGSEDSLSTSQPGDENNEGGVAGGVKLTGWMQWTLARFTLNVYNPPSKISPENLKLTLDVEDIFFSLDIERVYHKLKLKVSTASIQHYCRSSLNHPWVLGPFQGLVMRGHDPDGISVPTSGLPINEDSTSNASGFLTATFTRACCSNLHSKLGTPSKTSKLLQKSGAEDKFVTEIAVKLQPLDIVLSPNTIGTILNVLNPLLKMPENRAPNRPIISPQQSMPLTNITSSSLPLLYLDLMAVRIVLPAANSHCQHDVVLIQFDGVNASPHPENPVCRIPVRSDIYQAAEKHRILGVPGSEVEDRQYQVDIVALTIKTGIWDELKTMLLKDVVPSLQNPALDWNEGRRPSSTPPALENMLPVIPSFNLCIVFAPAIIYREKTVVCGHSVEVNAVSEIFVTLSTEQIELCGMLAKEISNVLPAKSETEDNIGVAVPLWIPQPQLIPIPLNFDSIDSGLESYCGSTQVQAGKGSDAHTVSVHSVSVNRAISMSPVPSVPPTSTTFSSLTKRGASKEPFVPLEVLITGSAVSCHLCKPFDSLMSSGVLPLLYLRISQPHIFLSKLGESKTCQASVYDFVIRCGKDDCADPIVVAQTQMKAQDFVQSLFETRCGDPHPSTGIPPALLTLKWSQTASKPVKLEVDFGRPIRITIRVDILEFLNQISSEIISRWRVTESVTGSCNFLEANNEGSVRNLEHKCMNEMPQQNWSTSLKTNFSYFSSISLTSQKILLAVLTKKQDNGNVGISVDKINLSTGIAQHTVTNQIILHALVVTTQLGSQIKLLVNPWLLSLKVVLLWENWSLLPIIQVSASSEILSVDISPKQIHCLQQVSSEFSNYLGLSSTSPSGLSSKSPTDVKSSHNSSLVGTESDQQEQHYKEDLQAGAFQFIDGGSDLEDLPLIYQVVFSAGIRQNPTMAWRYPQPRALTRLFIQPLPFRDSQPGDKVDCVLQYWSDTLCAYKDYINFSLCESAACTVALPTSSTLPVVSSTWRVVLGVGSIQQPLPVNVKALAACLRVDSYFCPSLIPNIQTTMRLSSCNVTFWTEANGVRPMPSEFKRYRPDGCLPLSHSVLTFSLNQSDATFTSWIQGTRLITVNGTLRLDVLNYRTLNMHCCIEPFKLVSNLSIQPDTSKNLNVVSEPVTCNVGPSICHTLATASQLWNQYSMNVPYHFIIVTPFVICNNSCLPFRFRQSGTDEVITLECLQCHLYSWYSTRHPLSLRFSLVLTGGRFHWSKPVKLSREGSFSIILCDDESRDWNLVVTVKAVTNFINEVSVAGQLMIRNNLDSSCELLISSERQNSLVVPAQTSPPGVILSPHFLPSLRIRFPGISFTWSGLISLKGDGVSQTKQWVVKIPLQEKGEFRCLWCHVVWDQNRDSGRILVVLSSMYRIMSHLPCGAIVQHHTPDLNSSQSVSVLGRGVIQDLNCIGTPDVSHKLTFQLDGRVLSSSPEVPLSYSMIEGQFSNTSVSVNMDELLEKVFYKSQTISWPFSSSDWDSCNWASASQPDTVIHVKVIHGQEWIEPCNLQVDLRPWALLLNSLGCHISLQSSGKFVCSLPHMSILAPPTLESTFHLGLYIGTSVYLSSSLQLSCDKAFYMPHIAGLIPLKGHINTSVDCGSVITFVNIASSEENDVRLIHIRPSYVISNFSSKVLKIAPVVVGRKSNEIKENIMPPNVEYHTIILRPQKPTGSQGKALPITEWFNIAESDETLLSYLAVAADSDFSCPVQVSISMERQSVPVLVPCKITHSNQHVNFMLLLCSEQKDGQTFLTLWDQPYPPLVIHNLTRSSIIFAKAVSEKGGEAVPYSPDWRWQLKLDSGCSADYQLPGENESFPKRSPSDNVPIAVIANSYRPSPSIGYKWSEGISLSPCHGRLVGLPGTSGINVAVTKRGFTTHVTLSHSSHSEISPLDVRLRLSREAQLVCSNELENFENYAGKSDKGIESNDHMAFEVDKFVPGCSKTPNSLPEKTTDTVIMSGLFLLPPSQSCPEPSIKRIESKPGLEDVTCFIKGVTVIMSVEGDSACDCREIAALVMDDLALTIQPTTHPDFDAKELLVRITLGDFQLDNQEYARGGYDFPVVLMTQLNECNEPQPVEFNVSGSALTLVEMSRIRGSALDLVFTLDVSSRSVPDLLDASMTLTPLQIYIEDTYILELKDHLLKATPSYTLMDHKVYGNKPSLATSVNSSSVIAASSQGFGTCSLTNTNSKTLEDDQKGLLFFNLNRNISEEALEDKEEELFNVSEPENENIQGFGLIPESNVDEIESTKENKVEKDVLFESDLPWMQPDIYTSKDELEESIEYINEIPVPREVISAAQELACPLRLRSLMISPLVVHVSLHTSTTFYIGLDHSPLNFSAFQRGNLVTTAYRLGHALTLHYFLGAVYGSAWALVSLEMLGAPGGLARTVGTGLWDFVSLPYQGIQQGPRAFLTGVAHGSASLMRHVTAGTLTSVTKLAASWARTLDRLTLNQEDLRLTEEARRLRPQGLTQGLMHGLTEFGISLLGAMGSLVHGPLQYAVSPNPQQSFVNSLGRGVMGVFTRPLSGAAEFVALTGEGLLSGAGWSNLPRPRSQPRAQHNQCGTESLVKYNWKILQNSEQLLLAVEATSCNSYEPVVLLLTKTNFYIIHLEKFSLIKSINLTDLRVSAHHSDPTLVTFRILPLEAEAEALSRTRLAQFVRDSQRVIMGEQDVMSQSSSVDTNTETEPPLSVYVNPEIRDYLIAFVTFARRYVIGRDFPLVS